MKKFWNKSIRKFLDIQNTFIKLGIFIAFVGGVFIFLQTKTPYYSFNGSYICPDCNIILISLTNIGAQHMSLYGYKRDTTPNINKFSQNAIVFDNAFANASKTIPSGMSLFTSKYPPFHKMYLFDKSKLSSRIKTMTEVLQESGYKTAAFTGGGHYDNKRGFERGFDIYEPRGEFSGFGAYINDAQAWLEKNKNKKFFLFLQSFDAHCPFEPPPPFDSIFDSEYSNEANIDYSSCFWSNKDNPKVKTERGYGYWIKTHLNERQRDRFIDTLPEWSDVFLTEKDVEHLIALYDGSIAYADFWLGVILKKINSLGLDKNTIIILTSEHGIPLGKNGRFDHGGEITGTHYDEVLKIPLIIKIPSSNEGKRMDGLVQLIDIVPTTLELLGLSMPSIQGKSIIPLIFENKEINEYVYAKTLGRRNPSDLTTPFKYTEISSIRTKDKKLIKEIMKNDAENFSQETFELYDINSDPDETINIFSKGRGVENLLNFLNLFSPQTQ